MVTHGQLGVRLFGLLDGLHQFLFKASDTHGRCYPAANLRRLDNDHFNLSHAFKRPLRLGGTHRGGGIEHQLGVFFHLDHDTITEFPIQNDGAITKAANEISRTKNPRQQITKINASLCFNLHLMLGVDDVKGA